MPLVQIRHRSNRVDVQTIETILHGLTAVAADALTCPEGGRLTSKDVVIEVDDIGRLDKNTKDICIRVWAHDYPSRREALAEIRKKISDEVIRNLPDDVSWYVWMLLAPTSYGSDTEDK